MRKPPLQLVRGQERLERAWLPVPRGLLLMGCPLPIQNVIGHSQFAKIFNLTSENTSKAHTLRRLRSQGLVCWGR